jgi:YegS/Rv2252/BmrU family lipid kinase
MAVERGLDFSEHVTNRAGDATDVAREAIRREARLIVVVGGDGTVSEVVNGYLDSRGRPLNPDVTLGLFPSGTGSDLSRSLALGTPHDCLSAMVSGESRLIDAALIDCMGRDGSPASRCFLNSAAFGFGGDVAAFVNQWRDSLPRWFGGRLRFALAAIRALNRYANLPVRVGMDGQKELEILSNLLVVGNGRFAGGGMMLTPQAELDDGLLDLMMTDGATRLDVIRELPRIRKGRHVRNPRIIQATAQEILIESAKPLAVDADGESVGYTPARIRVLPRAVRFLGR